jgi:hypothetical protein
MKEDLDARMIELWEAGTPSSEIARELGITRNAVAGKLHRFKFSGRIVQKNIDKRLDAIKANVRQLEKERHTIVAAQTNQKVSVYKIEDKLVSLFKVDITQIDIPLSPTLQIEATAPANKPVQFDKLTARSCRFIINDGPAENFLFCGQEKAGRSYCKAHASLCYYKLTRKTNDDPKAKSS